MTHSTSISSIWITIFFSCVFGAGKLAKHEMWAKRRIELGKFIKKFASCVRDMWTKWSNKRWKKNGDIPVVFLLYFFSFQYLTCAAVECHEEILVEHTNILTQTPSTLFPLTTLYCHYFYRWHEKHSKKKKQVQDLARKKTKTSETSGENKKEIVCHLQQISIKIKCWTKRINKIDKR